MQAGKLDRRIQFLRAAQVDDGLSVNGVFAAYGNPVWAAKTDISDGERWRAGEVQAHVTTRFVVRSSIFTRGITPKDRLTCEGVEHDIAGIKEAGGRNAFLEITASARLDK